MSNKFCDPTLQKRGICLKRAAARFWNLYSSRILLSFCFCPTAFIYSIRYTSFPPFTSRYYSGCADTSIPLYHFKHNGIFKLLWKWGGWLSTLVKHTVHCGFNKCGGAQNDQVSMFPYSQFSLWVRLKDLSHVLRCSLWNVPNIKKS